MHPNQGAELLHVLVPVAIAFSWAGDDEEGESLRVGKGGNLRGVNFCKRSPFSWVCWCSPDGQSPMEKYEDATRRMDELCAPAVQLLPALRKCPNTTMPEKKTLSLDETCCLLFWIELVIADICLCVSFGSGVRNFTT